MKAVGFKSSAPASALFQFTTSGNVCLQLQVGTQSKDQATVLDVASKKVLTASFAEIAIAPSTHGATASV